MQSMIGLGVVFGFLILLVVCLHFSGMFFERFGYLFPEPEPRATAPTPAADNASVDNAAAVAIAMATAHRARTRR